MKVPFFMPLNRMFPAKPHDQILVVTFADYK